MGKLGYSSLTLTDITETIPISLVLQSNQEKSFQIKDGNLFIPDFTENEKELIIVPSLFLGTETIEIPTQGEKGAIYYQVSGETENGTEKNFFHSNTLPENDIYVDEKGCLHYKKNLTDSLTIEAYINDYENTSHGYTIEQIRCVSPITILLLEQNSNDYTMFISSANNREHFDENNSSPITLTALLYKGTQEVDESILTYEWDIVRDDDDDFSADWKKTTRQITISRNEISNVEIFQCEITITDGSELSFSAQKIIRDFTDGYTNQLIADRTLILTPDNKQVKLTNQIWHQTNIINNTEDQSRFVYSWKLLTEKTEEQALAETGKTIEINLEKEPFKELQENFSIFGIATIDGKTITANYADIKYQPISFTTQVSPNAVFVPVNKEGQLEEEAFSTQCSFKITNAKNILLDYNAATSSIEKDTYITSIIQNTEEKWDFTLNIQINKDDEFFINSELKSMIINVSYTFLNETFSTPIQVVKSYAGAAGKDGEPGVPAYNIYLSNDYYLFAGGETAATPNQNADFTILAYKGAEKLTISKIVFCETYTFTDFSQSLTREDFGVKGLSLSYKPATETFSFITEGDGNFLTSSGNIKMVITVKEGSKEESFVVYFNYGINYNGNSYNLIASENQIVYLFSQYKFNISQVLLSAYYRSGGVGENIAYTDGYITYSIDGTAESTPQKGNTFIFDVSLLSSSNSYIRFNLYKDAGKKELLDTETIPVLSSFEGVEIGGENILRWTKELPVEKGKWEKSGDVSIEKDGDFSYAKIDTGGSLISQKLQFENDYIGEAFCLSLYAYGNSTFKATIKGYKDFESSSATAQMELTFSNDTESWNKVFQHFNFSTDFSNNVKYFSVEFSGNIKIKKLKLENSNISSAWAASPYDVDYSNIVGTNLSIVDGYYCEVSTTDPYILFADNLVSNTYYTFSCANTSFPDGNNGDRFLCEVRFYNDDEEETLSIVKDSFSLISETENQQIYTFKTADEPGIYSFRIYASMETQASTVANEKILTLQQAKIEKGTIATPFFITDEYLEDLIKEVQSTAGENTAYIKVLEENGTLLNQKIDNDINALKESIKNSYVSINEKEGIISAATNVVYQELDRDYLIKLKNKIDIVSGADPYIQISTKSTDGKYFATKITNNQLGFYNAEKADPVAYINSESLNINKATFHNSFKIGDLIVSVTESGVGFTW